MCTMLRVKWTVIRIIHSFDRCSPTMAHMAFWSAQKEAYLRRQEEKKKQEIANANAAAEKATLEDRVAAAEKKATAAHRVAKKKAPVEDGDDGVVDEGVESIDPPPPPKKRLAKEKTGPKTSLIRRPQDSKSDDDDMPDDEIVRHGKELAKIRDLNVAYPLLSHRSQVAVKKGLKHMVSGRLRDHLTESEKRSIDSKRRDYEKAASARKKRNPFDGKRKHVGETYRKFMADINLVQDDSSSSSSSGDSGLDWSSWDK